MGKCGSDSRSSVVRARRFKALLVVLLVLVLCGAPAGGQTQTGAIAGAVRAPGGEAVAGASVTLSGPSLMGTKSSTSGAFGRFRFPVLPPGGDYVVEVTANGFRGERFEELVVEVGQTTLLDVDLELSAVADEISVSSSAVPLVDVTSAAASTHLGSDLLESVPVADRSWEDAVLLVPGVVNGSVAGRGKMFSSRGGSVADNQSAFDGVVNTSSQTNVEGAGIVYESIEEVQVLSGALPAEIGNVAGQYVNLVTKSGGNVFSGEVAVYYEDEDLQSDNVDGDLTQAGIEPTVLTDYEDWAANLGGPIARDKLWFNVSLGARDKARDVTGFPEDEAFENDYLFGKLSWQPTERHGFVGMYNSHEFDLNHFANVPLSQHTPEATRRNVVDNEILKLKWTGVPSANALVEVEFGTNDKTTGVLAQEGSGHAYFDLVTGLLSGGAFRSNIFDDSRDQARASFSLFRDGRRGSHQLKFGVEAEEGEVDIFSFNDISPVLGHLLFAGQPGLVLFSNSAVGVSTPAQTEGLHAFAQDTWQVSDRVTLNVGLRYNSWKGFFPPQSTPAYSYGPNVSFPAQRLDRELEALDWSSLEPRLAAAIALDGEGRSVLRLGLSRYHHGIAISYFNLANPNGLSSSTHLWVDADGDLFADPDEVFPALSTVLASPGAIDPGLDQPYTDEITVGFEKQLFGGLSLTVNAFYRESQDLVEDTNVSAGAGSFVAVDIADAGPDTTPGTADDGTLTVFNQISDFDNLLRVTNPDEAEREMKGVEVVASRRLSDRWLALASLVWQEATGTVGNNFFNSFGSSASFDDPNVRLNLDGPLQLDREWQAKLLGTYLGPLGFSFTGYLQYLTGVPVYREVTVLLNQGAVVVVADPKDRHREDDFTQLDLRVEKVFSLGRRTGELGLSVDVLNVFNANTVTRSSPMGGTFDVASGTYLAPAGGFAAPQEIQSPRIFRVGARLRF